MKSIKDIIDSLSDEEKEIHKDLISECEEREKGIDELKETAKSFEDSLNNFRKKIQELDELMEKLHQSECDKNFLETLPDEKFHIA